MSTHPYIAIEGPIGVGKTTLARILSRSLPAEVLLEVVEENPFLGSFYADRARYAFQTQIFFLLSRYHQQHSVIAGTLPRSTLVSDYLFAKDRLFAHLNLKGDELAMYERVFQILGHQIPAPHLVVYLRATTDNLMQRISQRDRPYERQMSREYIEALRAAYEDYFATYNASRLLVLTTDDLDIVRDPEARTDAFRQVRNALYATSYQPLLPQMDDVETRPVTASKTVPDWPQMRLPSEARPIESKALFLDYMRLAAGVGEAGRILAEIWRQQEQLLAQAGNMQEAGQPAPEAVRRALQQSLTEVLADLLQVADDAGIDLDSAYLGRLRSGLS